MVTGIRLPRHGIGWLAAVALLGVAGCGIENSAPSDPSSSPPVQALPVLPPRPVDLPLEKVNPCALLTSVQASQLGVRAGEIGHDEDIQRNVHCDWSNRLHAPDTAYLARLYVGQGADYALGSTTGHEIVQIEGFAAVQTSAGFQDPRTHCLLFVDVAQGQSLSVLYVNRRGDYPGINHEVACRLARDAAGLMVQNLRAMAH